MAPETEETTPEVVETTPEAPPVAPEETGAEPAEPEVSVLAEFRAARKAEREGLTEEAEAEAPVEPTVETKPEDPESEPVAASVEFDPAKHVYDPDTGEVLDKRSRYAKRVQALVRKNKEVAQERDQLMARIGQLETAPSPAKNSQPTNQNTQPVVDEQTEPKLEQFSNFVDPTVAHTAALARWHARQEVTKQHKQKATADRTAHVESHLKHLQGKWDKKADEVRKERPDFDQTYNVLYETLPTDGHQRPLVKTLLESPVGHDMAYYLGKNPQVIQELYNTPTLEAHFQAIGRLEAHVEAGRSKEPAKTASTPVATPSPPMNPVGGGATPINYNSQSATLAQFRKRHGVRGGRRTV